MGPMSNGDFRVLLDLFRVSGIQQAMYRRPLEAGATRESRRRCGAVMGGDSSIRMSARSMLCVPENAPIVRSSFPGHGKAGQVRIVRTFEAIMPRATYTENGARARDGTAEGTPVHKVHSATGGGPRRRDLDRDSPTSAG